MIGNTNRSFLARMRRKLFNWRLNREIFEKLFPHLLREANHGYAFNSDEQMNAQTEALDVQALLDRIERQTKKLPKSYGESFRHIMHRDLCERLSLYADVAERRTKPEHIDPRFVATRAQT